MEKVNKILGIITARAGSSGCCGKNYRIINGKPLIEWSIEAALQSKYIDNIVVTTNDPIIKDITLKHPAFGDKLLLVERPESLCTPTAKSELAMLHACSELKQRGLLFNIVCLLQPTSPARRDGLIDKCLDKMLSGMFDSVVTVKEETPFFWKIKKASKIEGCTALYPSSFQDCYAEPTFSILNRPMRQECEENHQLVYHENGNFYACYTNVLYEMMQRTGYNPALVPLPFLESLQIDTEEDFRIMEKLSELYGSFI